jgi:excisionase family DNA binding protein
MKWLTVTQVADMIEVNPETVRRWLRSGELRGSILGDRAGWRIPVEEVARFMAEREPAGDARSAAGDES